MCGGRPGYSRLVQKHRMARHEKEVVKELTHLIKTKGDSILNGNCKLSLTSVSLSILNERFKRLPEYDGEASQDASGHARKDSVDDIKYLFEFMQRISSLKVIHGSSTIQGQVRLHPFKNLRCLEVKKVPVHLLEGMHCLRPTLHTLIASRCVQTLQDLFESCGGDMSSAQSWPLLKTVCLSNNNLEVLDGSLRLVPSLEVLDLSFNQMTTMDGYLEYPTELLHVNLAFNRLEEIPTFALRVRHQLQTLILRNNNLENIDGIEELGELHELDLSHNCFSDHNRLHLLCYLHKLRNLNLCGNPLCYHVHHRRLAIQFLSPISARQVIEENAKILVDGKPVSNIEALYIPKNPVHYRKGSAVPAAFADIHSRVNQQLRSSARNSPNLPEDSEGDMSITSSSSRGKKSKKKARHAVISDFESSTDYSSREPSRANTPKLPIFLEPELPETSGSFKNGTDGALSREEIEATRKQLGPGWLVSLTARQDYQEEKPESSFDQLAAVKTQDDYLLNEDTTPPVAPPVEEDDGIVVILPKEGIHAVLETKDAPKGTTRPELSVQRSTSSGMAWGEGSDGEEEEVTDGEPFIVNLNDEDNTQMIIIIGDRFLWEKDITGDVMEKLDLKLLLTTEKCTTNGSNFAVKLSFEYLRRDRQGRLYQLENEDQQDLFCQHLDAHLQAKMEANKYKDMLHCLKCEAQFHKSLSIMGTDEFEFHEDGQVKDSGYKCPQCQSTMVVELDAEQVAQARGVGMETPVGSLKSLDSKTPLAASSVNTSPMKITNEVLDESSLSRDTDSFKSCPGTYSSFKSVGEMTTSFPSTSDSSTTGPKYVTADSSLSGRSSSFSNSPQGTVNTTINSVQYVNNVDSKSITRNKSVPKNLALTKSDSGVGSSPRQINNRGSGRNRIDSEESDITVISNPSQSSIAVLTNPSQDLAGIDEAAREPYDTGLRKPMTMSPVSNRSLSMDTGAELMKKFGDERDGDKSLESEEVDSDVLTPHGSLTTRAVSSMIDSVYEFSKRSTPDTLSNRSAQAPDNISRASDDMNVYNSTADAQSDNNSTNESGNLEVPTFTSYIATDSRNSSLTKQTATDSIVYNYEDYAQVDHRLKLWLTMNLFEDNEECLVLLRCGVVQYMIPDEYPAILVTTDKKIYIIKIIGEEKDDPAKWLKCTEQQPITELQYVDIGYNYQCFRLEFSTDFSSYTCIVRDEKRCKVFIANFTGVIQTGSLSTHSKLEGITKNFVETMENLREQVLLMSEPEDSFLEDDLEVREFVAGYFNEDESRVDKSKKAEPVTVVTTKALICLASQNYQWPIPRLQGPLSENIKKTEFSLIDKKHVNEIAQVNMYIDNPNLLTIEFFEDDSDTAELSCWEITVETQDTRDALIESIKEPWEAAFSVPLTIVQLTSTLTGPES